MKTSEPASKEQRKEEEHREAEAAKVTPLQQSCQQYGESKKNSCHAKNFIGPVVSINTGGHHIMPALA